MKFSVVIPAYNAENYIQRCLLSIINQTYKNIEVIVVNDGSTDRTQEIIEEIIDSHKEYIIKLINIPNGGLANARNVGIAQASGNYFCNLDSDDFLDDYIFEKISKIETPFDVCFYGWKEIEDGTSKVLSEYSMSFLDVPVNGSDAALMKLNKIIWICQGNAVYNLDMVKSNAIWNIPGINQAEDWYFIIRALLHAKKVYSVPFNAFNCTLRSSSMMHSRFNESHLQIYEVLRRLIEEIGVYNIPQEVKNKILLSLKREYLFSQVNIAKKIIDSYRFKQINEAVSCMKKYCTCVNIPYKEIKNTTTFPKGIEFRIFSFSKHLFFCVCKFYRFINK